jgi:hypothetical protein
MAVRCRQLAAINGLQLVDDLACGRRKRRLALEGVKDDAFEQVAEVSW